MSYYDYDDYDDYDIDVMNEENQNPNIGYSYDVHDEDDLSIGKKRIIESSYQQDYEYGKTPRELYYKVQPTHNQINIQSNRENIHGNIDENINENINENIDRDRKIQTTNELYSVGISLIALHGSIKIHEPRTSQEFIDAFEVPEGVTIYKINASPPGVCNLSSEKDMEEKMQIIEDIFSAGLRDNKSIKDTSKDSGNIRDSKWLSKSIQSYLRSLYGGKEFYSKISKYHSTIKPSDEKYLQVKEAKYAYNKFYTMNVYRGAGVAGKKPGEKGDVIHDKMYVSGGQPLGDLDMNVTIMISDKQNDIFDSQINLEAVSLSYIVKTLIDLGKKELIIVDETCSIFQEEDRGLHYRDPREIRKMRRTFLQRNIPVGGGGGGTGPNWSSRSRCFTKKKSYNSTLVKVIKYNKKCTKKHYRKSNKYYYKGCNTKTRKYKQTNRNKMSKNKMSKNKSIKKIS